MKVVFETARFQRFGVERAAADSDDSQRRRDAGWECLGWLRFAGSFLPGKLRLG